MQSGSRTVYVVDDDVSVCRSLSLLLRSHGFKVKTFEHAQEFLDAKHLKTLSCLVLDVSLPGIDGITLQEEMAARQINIPIVFITGHGDIPMSVKAMKKGAVDFLTKPFNDTDLLEAIDRAIAKNKVQKKNRPKYRR